MINFKYDIKTVLIVMACNIAFFIALAKYIEIKLKKEMISMSKFEYSQFENDENYDKCVAFNSEKYTIDEAIQIYKECYESDIIIGNNIGEYGIFTDYVAWGWYKREEDKHSTAGWILEHCNRKMGSCPVICIFMRDESRTKEDNELDLDTLNKETKREVDNFKMLNLVGNNYNDFINQYYHRRYRKTYYNQYIFDGYKSYIADLIHIEIKLKLSIIKLSIERNTENNLIESISVSGWNARYQYNVQNKQTS